MLPELMSSMSTSSCIDVTCTIQPDNAYGKLHAELKDVIRSSRQAPRKNCFEELEESMRILYNVVMLILSMERAGYKNTDMQYVYEIVLKRARMAQLDYDQSLQDD